MWLASAFEIESPALVIIAILLAIFTIVYQKIIRHHLDVAILTTSPQRHRFKEIVAELQTLREEASKLQGFSDVYDQYCMIQRKIWPLEKELKQLPSILTGTTKRRSMVSSSSGGGVIWTPYAPVLITLLISIVIYLSFGHIPLLRPSLANASSPLTQWNILSWIPLLPNFDAILTSFFGLYLVVLQAMYTAQLIYSTLFPLSQEVKQKSS